METNGRVKVLFICDNRVIPDFSKKQFTQSYARGGTTVSSCVVICVTNMDAPQHV
jgi:hypothetical protein